MAIEDGQVPHKVLNPQPLEQSAWSPTACAERHAPPSISSLAPSTASTTTTIGNKRSTATLEFICAHTGMSCTTASCTKITPLKSEAPLMTTSHSSLCGSFPASSTLFLGRGAVMALPPLNAHLKSTASAWSADLRGWTPSELYEAQRACCGLAPAPIECECQCAAAYPSPGGS